MPGLVLGVGSLPCEGVRAATRQLAHVPWHSTGVTSVGSELAIGWAGMPQSFDSTASNAGWGREVFVCRYGHAFSNGQHSGAISAAHILRNYFEAVFAGCC